MNKQDTSKDMLDIEAAPVDRKTVTDAVLQFYRLLPFNYEQTPEQTALHIRENNAIAAAYPALDRILKNARRQPVLDVGCGAGWFVNTVAYHYGLPVVGMDMCETALDRARAVTRCLGVEAHIQYLHLDLFQATGPQMRPIREFYVVNSLGVLHHTHDCRQALSGITDLVKPEGFLHVGLYHKYGRKPFLDLFQNHRQAYDAAGDDSLREEIERRALHLYQELNPSVTDPTMLRSWFRDQVLHPRESQHTLEELYQWLTHDGFDCLSTSLNQFNPAPNWNILFIQEKEQYELSYQRNIKEKKYFPGFFVVLARKQSQS